MLSCLTNGWTGNTLRRSSEELPAGIFILLYLRVSAWHQMARCSFRTQMAAVKHRYTTTSRLGGAVHTLTCKMRVNVIPALQMPIAAKPPIMRGRLPSLSMVKHCKRKRTAYVRHALRGIQNMHARTQSSAFLKDFFSPTRVLTPARTVFQMIRHCTHTIWNLPQ